MQEAPDRDREDLTPFFPSTDDSRHIRNIEENEIVSVAIFVRDQPEHSPNLTLQLDAPGWPIP